MADDGDDVEMAPPSPPADGEGGDSQSQSQEELVLDETQPFPPTGADESQFAAAAGGAAAAPPPRSPAAGAGTGGTSHPSTPAAVGGGAGTNTTGTPLNAASNSIASGRSASSRTSRTSVGSGRALNMDHQPEAGSSHAMDVDMDVEGVGGARPSSADVAAAAVAAAQARSLDGTPYRSPLRSPARLASARSTAHGGADAALDRATRKSPARAKPSPGRLTAAAAAAEAAGMIRSPYSSTSASASRAGAGAGAAEQGTAAAASAGLSSSASSQGVPATPATGSRYGAAGSTNALLSAGRGGGRFSTSAAAGGGGSGAASFGRSPGPTVPATPLPGGGGVGAIPPTPGTAGFVPPTPASAGAVPPTPNVGSGGGGGGAYTPTTMTPGGRLSNIHVAGGATNDDQVPPTQASQDSDNEEAGTADANANANANANLMADDTYVPPPRSDLHGASLKKYIDDFDDFDDLDSIVGGGDDDGDDNNHGTNAASAAATSGRRQRGGARTSASGGAGGGGGGGGDSDDSDNDDMNNDGRSRRSDSSSRRIDRDYDDIPPAGGGGSGAGGGGGGGGGPPPMGNDDDDEDDDAAGIPQVGNNALTQIRGTDIHVQTAAAAFRDFIRNFVSVEASTRKLRREERARRREARAAAGGADAGSDAPSSVSSDTYDASDDEELLALMDEDERKERDKRKQPLYASRLRAILLGDSNGGSTTTATEDSAAPGYTAIGGTSTASLDINTLHLYYHSPACQRLYHQLLSYPAEIVPLMDLILQRELESIHRTLHDEMATNADPTVDYEVEFAALPELGSPLPRVQVRPYNLRELSQMRALDPNAIDTLLTIRGMVVRSSPIIPDLKVAHFCCTICGTAVNVTIDRGRIAEPTRCNVCNVKGGYELVHNRCVYSDKQMVRIQETPDEVPAGETPASVVLFAYDDLVDAVRPGDRVEVTGVFRAQARRVNPKITRVKSVYRTYVDVIHFGRVGAGSDQRKKAEEKKNKDETGSGVGKGIADARSSGDKLSEERIKELEELARSPDIYDKLKDALAPSIWELDDVKRGVLCMLFGGNSRRVKRGTAAKKEQQQKKSSSDCFDSMDEDDGDDNKSVEDAEEEDDDPSSSSRKLNKRGDINILLCGDPGTSKSQLLGYVHKLAPRGVYTSGKGSSAVGLTASVVRDPETRDLVLESGALVLSDLGICCIDEFDKMSDTTRAILHEAMEQQTVSIAKAGIIATLNARTSILASANPVESRYNPALSVVENIKLSPTLLSRFDLIYLILDSPNVENDRRLAQHLVGLYYETPNVVEPPLDHNLLRDYIAYARDNIHPELSDLATRELISAYLDMRRIGSGGAGGGGSRTISATPRQLESLIRLSEALARMRYSRVVARSDVREAVRLMKVATQAAATDPRTGRIDMDMITTGRSSVDRENEESLNISLKELLAERRGTRMAVGDVRRQLTEVTNVTVENAEVIDALRRMEADGVIQFNERAQTIFVRAGVSS